MVPQALGCPRCLHGLRDYCSSPSDTPPSPRPLHGSATHTEHAHHAVPLAPHCTQPQPPAHLLREQSRRGGGGGPGWTPPLFSENKKKRGWGGGTSGARA